MTWHGMTRIGLELILKISFWVLAHLCTNFSIFPFVWCLIGSNLGTGELP